MADKISIDDQIKHMEDTLRNNQAFAALTKRYVAEGQRPQEVLDEVERRTPYWQAILATLKWIKENREIIIAAKKRLDK